MRQPRAVHDLVRSHRPASRRLLVTMAIVLSTAPLTGCAAFLAVTKPGRKDLGLLDIGTPRRALIGEFGLPQQSIATGDGTSVDAWSFTQGDSKWLKVPKAIVYIGLDVFTLGIWEIIGTPMEVLLRGDARTYVVNYDERGRVRGVTILGRGGFLDQNGEVPVMRIVTLTAASTASPLTLDLDRQASLASIADHHGVAVTQLHFEPGNGKGRVTIDGLQDGDAPRVQEYLEELCGSENGLLVRWTPKTKPKLRVYESSGEDGRRRVRFRCRA